MPFDVEELRHVFKADLTGGAFKAIHEAIWVEHGEVGQTKQLAEVNRSVKWAPQQFPCAELMIQRGMRQNPDGSYHDIIYEVTVFLHVIGNDEERIEDELNRLVRAVQDFYIIRPHVMNYAAYLGNDDYSPIVSQGDNRPYVKSAAQTIFVRMQRS